MRAFLNAVAAAAALVAVLVSLWHDYGLFVTLRRAVLAYLGFFILGALLVLIYRLGIAGDTGQNANAARHHDPRGASASPPANDRGAP
jgi:hypothetical protein